MNVIMTRRGGPPAPAKKSKLLDQVRLALRVSHYSRRTEEAYVRWIRRFVLFHGRQHPAGLGEQEVAQFLSNLAREGRVSASTQSQAASAVIFLYKKVLRRQMGWIEDVARAKAPRRLPVVLTREEVKAVLQELHGTKRRIVMMLYGSGLRLNECLRCGSRISTSGETRFECGVGRARRTG